MMIDCVRQMTVKKFCKYGEDGSFVHLLFLPSLLLLLLLLFSLSLHTHSNKSREQSSTCCTDLLTEDIADSMETVAAVLQNSDARVQHLFGYITLQPSSC